MEMLVPVILGQWSRIESNWGVVGVYRVGASNLLLQSMRGNIVLTDLYTSLGLR